jgi:HEAT repeat protein
MVLRHPPEPWLVRLAVAMSDPVAELAEKLDGRIGDFTRYRELIREIGRRRLAEGAPLLAAIVARNAAFEASSTGYEDVTLALEALAELRDRAAPPTVRHLLATLHFSERATVAAMRHLAAAGDRLAAPVIAAFLSDDRPDIRRQAASALGALSSAPHANALVERLDDRDAAVARAAAVALALIGDRRAKALLEAELALRPAGDIVDALAEIGDSDSGVAIAHLAGHPEPALRCAVATALGALDLSRFRQIILRLAADPDPEVREAAQDMLG